MDNSHLAHPSPEWLAYGAANPHLGINDPDLAFATPAALRDAANSAKEAKVRAQLANSGLDRTVSRTDLFATSRDGVTPIPLRAYRSLLPPSPSGRLPALFIYYHGGGMLLGTLSTEDANCCTWASLLGPDVLIISVNYRHTPEFVFPTQQHDAWDAFLWIYERAALLGFDPDRVVVGGISSGGNLAASIVLEELKHSVKGGKRRRIKGQILAMPWLVHRDAVQVPLSLSEKTAPPSSLVQCRGAPVMSGERYDLFTDLLGEGCEEGFSVGLVETERLRGSPATAVLACGWDLLRDEAFAFAERLEGVGTPLKKHIFPGLPHAFTKYPDLSSSRRFDALMAESIQWCLSRPEPLFSGPTDWTLEIPDQYNLVDVEADVKVELLQQTKKACYDWVPFLGGKLMGYWS